MFLERELTLDGAVVSAVFHDSMDMGVVGTTAGTLWYISWVEGTSTRLISGHRSKVSAGRAAAHTAGEPPHSSPLRLWVLCPQGVPAAAPGPWPLRPCLSCLCFL